MIVAHLGPPLGRLGGPSGYLAQLASAVEAQGTGDVRVLLPAPAPAALAGRGRPRVARLVTLARRLRRTAWGAPQFWRPAEPELLRLGGQLSRLIEQSWKTVQAECAPSLDAAMAARADVLFAHDPPSAELALARRQPGQQVWIFVHNPMPLALYLAWCWGVPERPWETVRGYPDVLAGIQRELRVLRAVDRIVVPSAEARGEMARVYQGFEAVMAGATLLLTGGAGPARRYPADRRSRLRRRFGLPAKEPVALFLGNAQPYRGLDVLLDALTRLPSRRVLPGVVAVAGCPPDTLPLHARLAALGRVEEVSDLLAAVDVVINVNRFSLFDLSTIEALEAGCPLLLHAAGGNLTFHALGAGCELIPHLDPNTVAEGLSRVLAWSPADRAALGARSRTCWEAHLTPRHLLQRHLDVYRAR
ncbi:MAG: glycosyltransferase family 4 protein [Acidobacteriota bacterium]